MPLLPGQKYAGFVQPVDIVALAGQSSAPDNFALPVSGNGGSGVYVPVITAALYAVDDAIGGIIEFANAALATGGGGVILDMVIDDVDGLEPELELWLFDRTFTAMVDNAPWLPSDADRLNCIGTISTSGGSWKAAGDPKNITIEATLRFDALGTSLFGQMVTRTAITPTAVDHLRLRMG